MPSNHSVGLAPLQGDTTIDRILSESGDRAPEAVAARILVKGAFNVNSTSKAAWMTLLAGLDRETITSLVFNGTAVTLAPNGLTTNSPYLTRQRMRTHP